MAFEEVIIGNARLILADCREVLPSLVGVDAVVSDPPYGIGLEHRPKKYVKRMRLHKEVIGDQDQDVGLHVLAWAEEKALPTVFFASPQLPWPGEWRNWLVWDKSGAVGGGGDIKTCWKRTWELIQITRNGPLKGSRDESVIRVPITPMESEFHRCQKPVRLMAYLLHKLDPKKPLDPFMGSGSTGVACVTQGLAFVGIEIDRRHFDTACERIGQAHAQTRLAL